MGQIGLQPETFYDMSPREFNAVLHGWNERLTMQRRDTYDSARMVAMSSLQPHVKKGKKLKPTDIAQFPWDRIEVKGKRKDGLMSYEQGAAMLSLLAVTPKDIN